MMTYHMVTVSIPYDMFIIVIVAMILLLIKYRYIFKLPNRTFLFYNLVIILYCGAICRELFIYKYYSPNSSIVA